MTAVSPNEEFQCALGVDPGIRLVQSKERQFTESQSINIFSNRMTTLRNLIKWKVLIMAD